jgi:diamine N-acetyltransferase
LGIKRFYLHVFKNNLPALITYKRAGFKKTSEEIKQNGEVEYRMEKDTY